jgi:hypothetical protein
MWRRDAGNYVDWHLIVISVIVYVLRQNCRAAGWWRAQLCRSTFSFTMCEFELYHFGVTFNHLHIIIKFKLVKIVFF